MTTRTARDSADPTLQVQVQDRSPKGKVYYALNSRRLTPAATTTASPSSAGTETETEAGTETGTEAEMEASSEAVNSSSFRAVFVLNCSAQVVGGEHFLEGSWRCHI